MSTKNILVILFFYVTTLLVAQEGQQTFEKKKISATRISSTIKIDGILDEIEWKNAEIAKDFLVSSL